MPALDRPRPARPRPKIVWALGGLLALGVVVALATVLRRGRHLPSSTEISQEEPDAKREAPQVTREEVRRIEAALIALDRRIGMLETARASQPYERGSEVAPQLPMGSNNKDQDTRTPAEVHKSILRAFDASLAADRGDPRDRGASEERLRREISAAIDGKARAVAIACGTQFCRTTIEQDFAAGDQPLDINVIMEKAPSMRTESMFDYQTEGTRKRTIVYSSREGQLLPMERPHVAEGSGVGVAGEVHEQ